MRRPGDRSATGAQGATSVHFAVTPALPQVHFASLPSGQVTELDASGQRRDTRPGAKRGENRPRGGTAGGVPPCPRPRRGTPRRRHGRYRTDPRLLRTHGPRQRGRRVAAGFDHRAHRTDRIGEVDLPAHPEPHERPCPGLLADGRRHPRRHQPVGAGGRPPDPAATSRHALPAPQPVPDVGQGQRGVGGEGTPHRQGQAARRRVRAPSDRGRPVGRGEGPPGRFAVPPVGRPAAAAVPRSRPRRRTRGAAARRADLVARPGDHGSASRRSSGR